MKGQRAAKRWLWIGLGGLLLAAVIALGFFLLSGEAEKTADDSGRPVLYWNVDRKSFVGMGLDGDTGRMARSDGYYWVRFAVGGQQEDFPVADRKLVQKIDQLDVMGLEFDQDGVIVGVKNINECTGGLVASTLYVEAIEGDILHCNTQGLFRGAKVQLQITEDTEVYDVGQTNLLCGIAGTVQVDDEIMAVRGYDGSIIYIFRSGYQEPGPVYWNLERKYNSTTGYTTREPDAAGYYVYEMAFNGEVVTVRTRDMSVANAIDKKAARCTGLIFDENGLVIGTTNASTEAGGKTFASWARVFEVNQERVYAVKLSGSNTGEEFNGVLAKNCKIINTCGVGGAVGSYTDVRYGDQVHGLTDSRGKICYLFIVSRLTGDSGYKLYWNFERKYDSVNKVTTRTPAADGYYYFDVATGGEPLTVKTNNKALADKLDSYNARCFAMEIDGDNNILGFQSASSVHGGNTFGSWYYVDKIDGDQLTVSRILTGDTQPTVLEGVMAPDVEIINGSAVYSDHRGEYTTLKVGDRIHCLKDLDDKIRVIFVVEREVPGPVYWNIAKKAVKNGYTTRQRAEDGYFYFEMTAGGKQMTLKTKDITLATKIDSTSARCMGLTVRNGVILKHHGAASVSGCQGGTKSESWVDVTKLSGRTYTARKDPKSNVSTAGQYFTSTMASGCKIYNVSGSYNLFCGEPTTLRVGDRIHALHNRDGLTTVIFVVERKISLTEKSDCPCNVGVTWEPWDGTAPLQNGKYYYLTADVTAPNEGFMLEGIAVSLRLDGHTISSEGRCFYLKSNARLNICDHDTRGKLIGSGVDGEAGGVIRVYNSGDVVNLWNVDVCYQAGTGNVKEGGLISTSGTVSAYNCNLSGGVTSGVGGNVRVNGTGTFRMFGGTMDGGKASSGSNLYCSGRAYLEGAALTNGVATFNSTTDVIMKDVTAQNAAVLGGTVKLQGVAMLGNVTVTSGKLADGGVAAGSQITITCKPETAQVVMTGASETAFAALKSFHDKDYILSYDSKEKTVTMTCTIVPQTHENAHCACVGVAEGVGAHVCTELTDWTALTSDILVESPTSGNLAFPASGNYYLPLDLDLSASIDILPDQEITLCLNGCRLTDSKRMFRINGTLNLTDCTASGVASGSAALAPVFYTYAGGTLNLFGGTLQTTYTGTASYWGGVGAVANDAGNAADKAGSVFNMYGGTILGGKVRQAADGKNGRGGAVMIIASSQSQQVLNLYGGSILGGEAELGGSAVYASGVGAIANLLGGSIAADASGLGGEFYAASASSVTLGADVQVHTLRLGSGITVRLEALNPDAPAIGIRMDAPGVFAESETDLSGRFTPVDEGYEVSYSGGVLRLQLPSAGQEHVHCVCAGAQAMPQTPEHSCQDVAWQGLTQAMFDSATADSSPVRFDGTNYFLATGGHYYLQEDISVAKSIAVAPGEEIALCLNGKNLHGNAVRTLYFQGTLHLCDCDYTDETVDEVTTRVYKGTVTTTVKSHAQIFYARSGASFYFYGGNLIGGKVGSSFTSNSGTGIVGGSMYMYGGVITGGDCSANSKSGGNLRVDGTLEMYGGVISGGKAKEGGNIAIASAATVILKGGIIENGEAVSGGNIAAFGALTVADDAVIRGGVSTGTGSAGGGGNIYGYPNKVDIRIEGGSIENGKAAKFGANIFIRGNANGTNVAKLTVTGGSISGIDPDSGANAHSVYLAKNSGLIELSVGSDVILEDLYQDWSE